MPVTRQELENALKLAIDDEAVEDEQNVSLAEMDSILDTFNETWGQLQVNAEDRERDE